MLRALSLVLLIVSLSFGGVLDRCNKYSNLVRRYHYHYFGLNFPYWFSIGQLQKESSCRHRVLSSDGIGSEGLAQITWRVWKKQLLRAGIPEIKSIKNHLKAQAYINWLSYRRAICKKLWVMYQIYNGGTLVNKEIKRAGKCDHCLARRACKRRNVCFRNGQCINACDINYSYSFKVYKYGLKYAPLKAKTKGYEFW